MSRAAGLLAHWQADAVRPYRDRTVAAYAQLDERHFDALNDGGPEIELATCGCLDALDDLPMGGARSQSANDWSAGAYYPFVWVERDWLTPQQQAEREALAHRLISEILAEEAAAKA